MSTQPRPARLVVLVSGSGTNLQALLDASQDSAYGATVVAVGADRDGIEGLARAERLGVPTFVEKVKNHATREEWDRALTEAVAAHEPDIVVLAGFMKLVGPAFIERFGGRTVNTHPVYSFVVIYHAHEIHSPSFGSCRFFASSAADICLIKPSPPPLMRSSASAK